MQPQTSIEPTDTRILEGDCSQVMATMPPGSANLILTNRQVRIRRPYVDLHRKGEEQ